MCTYVTFYDLYRESKTRREYHLLKTYDLVTIGNSSHLIKKNEISSCAAPDTNEGI